MLHRTLLLLLTVSCVATAGCATAPWRGLNKVGLVQSFHGPNAESAMSLHVMMRDTLIDRNKLGGNGGVRLELVSLDDESNEIIQAHRIAELRNDPLVKLIVIRSDVPVTVFHKAPVPIQVASGPEQARQALLSFLLETQ